MHRFSIIHKSMKVFKLFAAFKDWNGSLFSLVKSDSSLNCNEGTVGYTQDLDNCLQNFRQLTSADGRPTKKVA